MKLTSIMLAILFCHSVAAYQVDGIKVFKGDKGGVVTVHKHVDGQRGEFRESQGKLTISDVRVEWPIVDAKTLINTRLSGKIRFEAEHQFQGTSHMRLNGNLRTFGREHHTLKLQDIKVIAESGDVEISGIVVIDDRDVDIQEAPDSIKNLVRRLIWWISFQ